MSSTLPFLLTVPITHWPVLDDLYTTENLSNFPNPNKAERREYAVYWQDKLKDNSELDFPDELLDKFAEGTDKFSFAYMKEVL